MPESTLNLLLSALLGFVGGLIATPVHVVVSWWLKRSEIAFQHKLDVMAKEHELYLQHELEMQHKAKDDDLAEIRADVMQLKALVAQLERRGKDE